MYTILHSTRSDILQQQSTERKDNTLGGYCEWEGAETGGELTIQTSDGRLSRPSKGEKSTTSETKQQHVHRQEKKRKEKKTTHRGYRGGRLTGIGGREVEVPTSGEVVGGPKQNKKVQKHVEGG